MQRGRALDEVSAALADVQARQQRLALGSVLPRTLSPPPSLYTAPSPHPPPVSKDKAVHTTSQFQWLKRRIVRRNEHQESGALEDLGSLDVVSSASLATVRTLIRQFIPLPARREFVFVHPMINTLVDTEQEKIVFAREFPFICIELLPGKAKPESAANIVALKTAEPRRPRPETAHSLPEQQQIEHKKRPRTVETGTDQQAVSLAVSNLSNSEAEISVTKITPVRTKRDRPAVLQPVQEGKTQTIDNTKGTSSVYVPEAKFVSEHKPAISASLTAGSRTRIFAKATGNEKKEGGVSQFRQTAKQGISSTGEVISLGTHQQEDENSTVAEDVHEEVTETVKLSSSNEVLAQHDCLLDFGNEDAAVTEGAVAEDDIVADESIPTPDAINFLHVDRPLNRKPGQLRRSRRFKALTVAKLAEKSWDTGELEQQEFLTDGNIEDFIGSFLEIVRTGLDGVGSHQVDEALLYYGIDNRVLELNQLLLALDSELSIRCNHVHGGVDGQLKQFLLKIFPVDGDNTMDAEGLQQFEYALNLFVGMRGWQYPTKLRARCFEERHPLQLIPTSDSRRLAMLRLTDRDRQLFALASSDNSTSRFENWLADGMEITYVLLYGFLLSRRNSGPKALAKLDTLHIRQERIQAAIQKLSSFSFDVWKRLEFRTTDLEETSMMRRLNELLNPFLRSNMYNGELVGSVFYPALVGYLTKKRDQLSQSLCTLFEPSTNGIHGSLQATVLDFLRLLRQYLEQAEPHSTTSNSYLQSMGLKIMDIDKINVSRSSAGLGRIYVNGNEAILAHCQCKLAARDRDLQLKARWDQPELSQGEISRYCFLGAKEIVLEYVFLRMKIGISSGEDMSWEDQQAIAKMEARQAFTFLCSDSLVVPPNVAIGIGANVVHADLLPRLSSILSLGTVLREYAEVTSVSFGYCSDSSGQNIRVMFRVHTLSSIGGHGYAKGAAGSWSLKSAFWGLDRFLASTQEEGAISFCEAGGLRFLNSYLHDREREWLSVKYGAPYFAHMYGAKGADMVCPRADILRTIKRAIAVTPNASYCITKTNIDIIVQLIMVLQEAPDVADEAIDVLRAICSNDNPPELTESLSEYVARPMTDSQEHFMRQMGLSILVDTLTKVEEVPLYKEAVKTMILSLLMTHEMSATKAGLLVHHKAWHDYYVETRSWTNGALGSQFLVYLLGQIHSHFFTTTSFVEPVSEMCPCGCSESFLETIDHSIGVMKILVRLMTTEAGLIWAKEAMQGPRDCLLFLLWCVQQKWSGSGMTELQELIFGSLCEFLDVLTTSHQYLCLLSELTPLLLALLHQEHCISLHTGALRVLSLTFRLAVDKKVWLISMEDFLAAFYQILENICGDSTHSNINRLMVNTLFHLESEMQSAVSSSILLLLHEEHTTFVGGSGQLSPVARSRSKSLLQTLVSFCSLTGASILQPVCQIPALICLGWLLTSLEIADDLAKLDVDDVLLTLMESESGVVTILAAQAYISHLFHGLLSCRLIDDHQLKQFCNQSTTVLATGSRLMLSPKRSNGVVNQEDIQFATNTHALYSVLNRYKSINSEMQSPRQQGGQDQDDTTIRSLSPTDIIWRSSEWNDVNRAAGEKVAVHLKLLVVFSSMTSNVISIGGSDEVREIILQLVRYVRERMHSASYYTTLYLLSLRNIIWATRLEISKWGITELTDPSFLRKLLLLNKDLLYQDLASGILWGLAEAYEKSNIFLLSFEVEDAGNYSPKKNGFAVMVDKLASMIAGNRSIENDAGALASMIASPLSSTFFLANYGYPFVLKLMEAILRLLRAEHIIEPPDWKVAERTGAVFGTKLFYQYLISNQHERELFQLCRAAVNVLEAMLASNPESILDEAARTKATILPLIDYPNKQVAVRAVLCCNIHLQAHPLKCSKLIDDNLLDKMLAFFFYEEFPPIQIAAFSCMKLVFADQKNLSVLQPKVFQLRDKIVSCLQSPVFEVKRKVILFLVEAVFRLDDQVFLDGIAKAFSATDNNGLLMEIFSSVSTEIAQNPSAGSVLQLLIRLITKLDLVAHTGGDQLVHVICQTLKTHSTDTFLRPLLFNFLHQIVTQDGHVEYLERRNRLDVITELLSYDLTMSELRNVGNMLSLILSKREGIRQYLSGFDSGCIPKLAGVLDTFSEYVQSTQSSKTLDITPENANLRQNEGFEADAGVHNPAVLGEDAMKYLLKITTSKAIYISDFTEDVYVLFLELLYLVISEPKVCTEERYGCQCETGCSKCDPCDIIAKARCGHSIHRLTAARRVAYPPRYDLQVILSAKTEPADRILHLTPKVLRILTANYQTRMQMLRGSTRLDWMWMSALAKVATQSVNEDEKVGVSDVPVAEAILSMGHLSAAKDVAQRLIAEKALVSILFAYITPMSPLFASNVEIRRASSFTLARLAEYPVIVRDPIFQEKMAILSLVPMVNEQLSLSSGEQDVIVLANRMILSRNRALLTPGMQGRTVDDGTLSLLAHLLLSEEFDEVGALAADVLASLICFRVNVNDEKRFNSALWSYTRALSPDNSTKDPSSKRLTAYLHNWMRPMLRKLRHSSFGTFDEDSVQVLNDELDYTCKHFEGGYVASLLVRLTSLHLPLASENMDKSSLSYDGSDDILAYKPDITLTARPRGLQYVFTSSSRMIREQNDLSFGGSAHLWIFLQKLWELANHNSENQGQMIAEVTNIIAARLPPIFAAWGAERAARYSTMTFARRKCFLDFVISVGKLKPIVLNKIDSKHLVDAVSLNGLDAAATMGREYLLLVDICKLNPNNLDLIIARFGNGCANDSNVGKPSEIFRRFWQPVRLHLHLVTLTGPLKTKMTILDPCPEADLSTVFGLDLLSLLSSRYPAVLRWFAQSQGDEQLLDIMFLASKKSALHMQHFLVRSFLSNVLCLLHQLMELDPTNYQRYFASDPRYIRSVVDLVYAPAHEIQTSAIKLLQSLAKQPHLFALLSNMENVVKPIASVNADVVSYAGEMLNSLHLAPPLHPDSVVLLTHLLFVPFFSDLSTLELVKLSLGFRKLSQVTPSCWMILMNDSRFSSIPEWMMGRHHFTTSESFISAMKRTQGLFEGLSGVHTIYAIDRETYMSLPPTTRKRIAMRLDSLLKLHIDDSNLFRGSSRNALVMRLGRMLVDDQAEIIRRVAYTKRVSERALFNQMHSRQMSDLLLLLHESPLFENIHKDHLANLAFCLGSPVEFMINSDAAIQDLPLVLIYDENVEFEMRLPGVSDSFRGSVSRGGLLGFPPWLSNSAEAATVVHKRGLLGAILSLEALESELPEPLWNLVSDRLHRAYEAGDLQALFHLMKRNTPPEIQSGKRRLQSSASSLIAQLTTAEVFVESLLNDCWAIGVIVDVVLGAFPANVVLNALRVVAAMTASEGYTKRFCKKMMNVWNESMSDSLSPVITFVNGFKLRLWQLHPNILTEFFSIQSHFARYLPEFWPKLENVWTTKYLRTCVSLLRSEQSPTSGVIGCHLSDAIPHRKDFLVNYCGHVLNFNLEVAHVLVHTQLSGNIVGILRLFTTLGSEEVLCEQMWEQVIKSSNSFDGVLELVASRLSGTENTVDLGVYCEFLDVICTSGINEQLELDFRRAAQDGFGILSVLLERLQYLPQGHAAHVVLRCIGGMCADVPSNCYAVVTTSNAELGDRDFVPIVTQTLAELEGLLEMQSAVDPLVVEAVFSCIDTIISVSDQRTGFEISTAVSIGMQVIRLLPFQILNIKTVRALQSVVKVLLRVTTQNDEVLFDRWTEKWVAVIVAGYECISTHYSKMNDGIHVLRLLERYTVLLDALLSSPDFRNMLWTARFRDSDSISLVSWIYHWITFEPSESLAISALYPSRATKRDQLVIVTSKLQSVTLSSAIKMSEHVSINRVLNLHSKFPGLIDYIFSALRSDGWSRDVERAGQWVQFLCFLSEQWSSLNLTDLYHSDQQNVSAVHSILRQIHVPTLLKACSTPQAFETSFLCHAVRLLWVFVTLHRAGENSASSDDEWLELIPLATRILKESSTPRLTQCYLMGLLAEWALSQEILTSYARELVDFVQIALVSLQEVSLPREKVGILADSISTDYLCAQNWPSSAKSSLSDQIVDFSLIHQTQRLVVYLTRTPEIRLALSTSGFFHPLMCGKLFRDAVVVLSVQREKEPWVKVQVNALALIKDSLTDFTGPDSLAPYRLVARRESFLPISMDLLTGAWSQDFKCEVVEALIAYVNQNISGSCEVAIMREQNKGDLMKLLATSITLEDEIQESLNFAALCVRLFNAIIEYSVVNAKYAANTQFLEFFRKLRMAASELDHLLRTFYWVIRMLSGSHISPGSALVQEVWELITGALLYPQHPSRSEEIMLVLEIFNCSGQVNLELLARVESEWRQCGKNVVSFLIKFAQGMSLSSNSDPELNRLIVELSMKAMERLCSSDVLAQKISSDPEIVAALLSDCEFLRNRFHPQLLTNIMSRQPATRDSLLARQLSGQVSDILALSVDHAYFLLELLPCFIGALHVQGVESVTEPWDGLLRCIEREMDPNTRKPNEDVSHLLIAAQALNSVVNFCDFRDVSRDILCRLHCTLKQQLTLNSNSNGPRDPENDIDSAVTQQPALGDLLLLAFIQICDYLEEELPLVEPRYFSLWMDSSVCRLFDVVEEPNQLLLSSLAFQAQQTLVSPLYWRILTRMFVSFIEEVVHMNVSKLLLSLLQDPTNRDYLNYVADTFNLDLIDVLWWEVSTTSFKEQTQSSNQRELWYSLLYELCYERDNALEIMNKGFLEGFIRLEGDLLSGKLPHQQSLVHLLRLLSCVLRSTDAFDHAQFFQNEPSCMEVLAEMCISTVTFTAKLNEAKWNATEILHSLAANQQTLTAVWKACYFDSPVVLPEGKERLCAVSELLLQCPNDLQALVMVLELVLKICVPEQSVHLLVRARNSPQCWPMVDILAEVLRQCLANSFASSKILQTVGLSTTSPTDFLPSRLSSSLEEKATVLALQLVRLCATDPDFVRSSEPELDFLSSLVTCLATSHWDVASTAAETLNALIQNAPEICDGGGVARYMCDYGAYRRLDFFLDAEEQNLFRISPPSLFPSWFVLFVRWIRFYSVNLHLLGLNDIVERFTTDAKENLVALIDATDADQRNQHELIASSILELLLYTVSNFHPTIYKTDSTKAEEKEHQVFLRSLLSLCQRRPRSASSLDYGDNCVVWSAQIRSRALELVQLLCSLDLPHTVSVEVFRTSKQMEILMLIVERSTSDSEQYAAVQLMQALALHEDMKAFLIKDTSLLFRFGVWLESPRLQLLAASILQRLAAPSSTAIHSRIDNVFNFSPSAQLQLAQFLFVGVHRSQVDDVKRPTWLQNVRTIQVEIAQENVSSSVVVVQLKIEIVNGQGVCLRAFEYNATLRSGNESSALEFLVETTVETMRSTVFVSGGGKLSESKFEVSRGFGSSVHSNSSVTLRLSEISNKSSSSSSTGILSRLLRQEGQRLSLDFFLALSGLVSEFCKDYRIYYDPIANLKSQILAVLALSTEFSTIGRMDVTCLESLTRWFPSKPTVSTLKLHVTPVLKLLQGLRQLSCVATTTAHSITDTYQSSSTQFIFLETFVELIGSIESHDLTFNVLNTLFMENSDSLLYLCYQFKPERSSEAIFLSLVAIAVRRNVVHCQAFLTSTAQSLLLSVFNAGVKKSNASEENHGNLLYFAALVAVRLARCPSPSTDVVESVRSLNFFSRVSFEIFCHHLWTANYFPVEAAENIILTSGFLCSGVLNCVTVDVADTQEGKRFEALVSTDSVPENGLAIVETLLMFLGRKKSEKDVGQGPYDSFDRLASTILSSLVEKAPSRISLDLTVLQILNGKSHKTDKIVAKTFEEQCLSGMRKCITLSRYDFQSELNTLRLTYYSSIRAGVRTGIIPPQCSGVFQRFDQEHLLPSESVQWHLNQFGGNDHVRRAFSYVRRHSGGHHSDSSTKHLQADEARIDSELRELILFSQEHDELLSVLTANRKKAMSAAIRDATQNARVLSAFHAMASIALDFFMDSQKLTKSGNVGNSIFLEWLLLLEQLAGFMCSGLHELQASYYVEIARQFRSLILDLPAFLRKMERHQTHSRQQALMVFLDNLHRLLKRATNRNELRVIAANGSGIVDQAKTSRERLRGLDVQFSASLAVLLDSPQGMDNLSRMLVAMQYMWLRTMGSTSLETTMTSSRQSVSLFKKIKGTIHTFLLVLRKPTMLWRRHRTKTPITQEFADPSDIQKIPEVANSEQPRPDTNHGISTLTSSFPFTSLEFLLDHFGLASVAAKRTKVLLQFSKHKNRVIEILKAVIEGAEENAERMSVFELAENFHEMEIEDVFTQLGEMSKEDEMPFTSLPFVVHDQKEMSLWRLMVRPIQRLRVFHLYQQMQRFVASDSGKRRIILESYGQASPHRLSISKWSRTDVENETEHSIVQLERKTQGTSVSSRLFALKRDQRVGIDQFLQEKVAPVATGPWTALKAVISSSSLQVCDEIFNHDPFSDAAAMVLLRRKLEAHRIRRHTRSIARFRSLTTETRRSAQYRYDKQDGILDKIRRGVVALGVRLVLLVAFWRQEELRTDLQDPVMAQAFDNPQDRDEFYRFYHAKKGLGELVRVWMPSSGKLGLPLWQERRYAFGGTALSVLISFWVPTFAFAVDSDVSKRNIFMTRIVYSYGIGIFLLSVVSIALIARSRFVLLEQTRLRLRPVSRYYQNILAVTAIGVELVQLNSLAFDSSVDWDSSDDLPAAVEWLGGLGITKFGISSLTEVEALGLVVLLLLWFLLLKCANKFRETSALLHRVLTKDLPALVHGFLYMGTISIFFSYLACTDCSTAASLEKCKLNPQSPPFLIAHKDISCWTAEHRWYALVGLWGVTFFLPIGLLAHGMSQVLFQRDTLDIKYAPVLLLVTQLVKAAAATAQAFFPFNPLALASLGAIGNAGLLVLTLTMHSCSLWYIKYVKCSIYAASCWASLGAIHRLHYPEQSSTRSLNMIYVGWLSIVLTAAVAILARVWLRAQAKHRDAERHFAAQQRLLHSVSTSGLSAVERKFVKAAMKHSDNPLTREAFVENATRLGASAPPLALAEFMVRANEPADVKEAARGVLFVQNARVLAKKLHQHQELRRRW